MRILNTCKGESLSEYLSELFPKSFEQILKKDLINKNLFSPFTLPIPVSILERVKDFVSEVYAIKESAAYQNALPENELLKNAPATPSVLTCFDFHHNPTDNSLKLIEINTNASLYLPIIMISCAQGKQCADSNFEDLLDSFKQSFSLNTNDRISILDEIPEQEGLYFEFLLMKEWFEQNGLVSNIIALKDYTTESFENVYNRFTDFYFDRPESKPLKADYYQGTRKFSPNPREYFLMADKKRLRLLREFLQDSRPELAEIIPQSKLFSEFADKEDLWSQRKKYFFKPSQSFGSKGVFSGKGISRVAFENIYHPDFMAQELAPAGKKTFQHSTGEVEMKYDLRFFTFNGKVQNYGARIYQGQATNMKTPLGGITPIVFR